MMPRPDFERAPLVVPRWLDRAKGELRRLADLPEDWDSYGGRPPNSASIARTLEVLDLLMEGDVPLPNFIPTSDGGVQLEWHRRGIDLEIEVKPSGRVAVYYLNGASGTEWEKDLTSSLDSLVPIVRGLA